MNPLRLFRVLVGAQIGIVALALIASIRLERTLPEPLQAYLRAQQDAPLDAKEIVVGVSAIVLLAALVVAWIALLRFWQFGPWLYLATTVGGFLLALAAGPTVVSAIETALDTASSVIEGFILAMAFFSDLRVKFRAGAAE